MADVVDGESEQQLAVKRYEQINDDDDLRALRLLRELKLVK